MFSHPRRACRYSEKYTNLQTRRAWGQPELQLRPKSVSAAAFASLRSPRVKPFQRFSIRLAETFKSSAQKRSQLLLHRGCRLHSSLVTRGLPVWAARAGATVPTPLPTRWPPPCHVLTVDTGTNGAACWVTPARRIPKGPSLGERRQVASKGIF